MVDLVKIEAIHNWSKPASLVEVYRFYGLSNLLQMVYREICTIIVPMTRLTKKDVPFQWSNECESSFLKIKDFLTLSSILTLPIKSEGFTVYYDGFGVGLGCVLMQLGRVITYALIQLKVQKWNYPIYDLELELQFSHLRFGGVTCMVFAARYSLTTEVFNTISLRRSLIIDS